MTWNKVSEIGYPKRNCWLVVMVMHKPVTMFYRAGENHRLTFDLWAEIELPNYNPGSAERGVIDDRR